VEMKDPMTMRSLGVLMKLGLHMTLLIQILN